MECQICGGGYTSAAIKDGVCMYCETEIAHDYDDDYSDEAAVCERCGGDGVIIICWDDVCVGAGECMHGDGEILCPKCGGDY